MHADGTSRRNLCFRGGRQLAVLSAVFGHRVGGIHADAWIPEEKSKLQFLLKSQQKREAVEEAPGKLLLLYST